MKNISAWIQILMVIFVLRKKKLVAARLILLMNSFYSKRRVWVSLKVICLTSNTNSGKQKKTKLWELKNFGLIWKGRMLLGVRKWDLHANKMKLTNKSLTLSEKFDTKLIRNWLEGILNLFSRKIIISMKKANSSLMPTLNSSKSKIYWAKTQKC